MAKSTRTVDMDPERFNCILSEFSKKQKAIKRNYLQSLPFYIDDKKAKQESMQLSNPDASNLAIDNSKSKKKAIQFDSD